MEKHSLNIASYNILNPGHALEWKTPAGIETLGDGSVVSNWPKRAPWVRDNLTASDFHIACLQEVGFVQAQFLACAFSLLATGYPDNGANPFIFKNALLYRPDVLRLEDRYEIITDMDPALRIVPATMAIFTHLPSNHRIAAVSVHLKGYVLSETNQEVIQKTRPPGYRQLAKQLAAAQLHACSKNCWTMIVAGDFNEHLIPNNPMGRAAFMEKEGYKHDGNLIPSEPSTGRKIDWIFARGALLTPLAVNWPHPPASDHLPIASRLEF